MNAAIAVAAGPGFAGAEASYNVLYYIENLASRAVACRPRQTFLRRTLPKRAH
jgi:hypothetical protein